MKKYSLILLSGILVLASCGSKDDVNPTNSNDIKQVITITATQNFIDTYADSGIYVVVNDLKNEYTRFARITNSKGAELEVKVSDLDKRYVFTEIIVNSSKTYYMNSAIGTDKTSWILGEENDRTSPQSYCTNFKNYNFSVDVGKEGGSVWLNGYSGLNNLYTAVGPECGYVYGYYLSDKVAKYWLDTTWAKNMPEGEYSIPLSNFTGELDSLDFGVEPPYSFSLYGEKIKGDSVFSTFLDSNYGQSIEDAKWLHVPIFSHPFFDSYSITFQTHNGDGSYFTTYKGSGVKVPSFIKAKINTENTQLGMFDLNIEGQYDQLTIYGRFSGSSSPFQMTFLQKDLDYNLIPQLPNQILEKFPILDIIKFEPEEYGLALEQTIDGEVRKYFKTIK